MLKTIARDANNAIKIRATVAATWSAFGPIATPEEITHAINSQINGAGLSVAQVKRSMRDMGEPQTPGSNHYRRTHSYGTFVNPRWQRSR